MTATIRHIYGAGSNNPARDDAARTEGEKFLIAELQRIAGEILDGNQKIDHERLLMVWESGGSVIHFRIGAPLSLLEASGLLRWAAASLQGDAK